MLPWGHLAFGYFVYTVGTRLRTGRAPSGPPTIVLAFGTQFPDLVDKPLNWWFNILDGRGIGHSLVASAILCGAVLLLAHRYERLDPAGAFSVGVFTHLLGDSWRSLLSGEYGEVLFLLWPFYPAPTYPKDSLSDHLQVWIAYVQSLPELSSSALLSSRFGIQLLFVLLLFAVWGFDGFPGVRTLWRVVTGARD